MEISTINRVVETGKVMSVKIFPIAVGTEKRKMGVMEVNQWDVRKKENEDSMKNNLYIVKAVGDAVKTMQEVQSRLRHESIPVNVILRGTLQSRIKKDDKEERVNTIPSIFLTDEDSIEIISDFVLVNEATFAGRIYQSESIKTKIKEGSLKEPDSVRVNFVLQVGKTQVSENPFSTTKPSNLVFCVYKPKNYEAFRTIQNRFMDSGTSVFLTGALISKIVNVGDSSVYRLEVIVRQIKIASGKTIKFEEKEVESVYNQ